MLSLHCTIRAPAVAGSFYPGRAEQLVAEVDRWLGQADAAPAARPPKMLLVPHAGYRYSGPIAANAYALLAPWRGRIRRVVMLGPTHRVAVHGLAVPGAQAFATPLGEVPVDREALAALADLPQVVRSDAAHAGEHALEVQLPFLQRVLSGFGLVPLAVGHARPEDVAEMLQRLWGGPETLVVISSDLSHYLPYEQAVARDRATVEQVLRLDPALDHVQACGATPLAGALIVSRREGLRPRLLDLRNSGDTAGDRKHVVGYAAVAFEPGAAATARDHAADEAAEALPADDERRLGAALLAHARNAIAAALGLPTAPEPAHPALAERGATFVTLRCDGALRGCLGSLEARRRLRDDVRAHAVAAAFDDRRFAPLTAPEFAMLHIEVSLLDAPAPLLAASEAEARAALRPGVDGVILEWRSRRATLLPQVWNELPHPAAFLRALKLKAGLPPGFWADDLRLARYRVRKFGAVPMELPA